MILRDKLEQRQADLFTNRESELNEILYQLDIPVLSYNLIHVSGIGGIGKSSLLRAFTHHCSRRNIPVAMVDGRTPHTTVEVLALFQSQFHRRDKFTDFNQGLRKYIAIQNKLQKPSSASSQIIQLATKGITLASQLNPLSSLAVQIIGPESVQSALELIQQVLTKEEIDFYLDAESVLTQKFTQSLKKLADQKRTVLIFDSFEQMVDLSVWLADKLVGQLPENVLVILAGRERLSFEWEQWRPLIREIPLTPFTKIGIEIYLRKRGIDDHRLIEDIGTFTGGLPLGLATCADLNDREAISVTGGLLTSARLAAINLLIDRIVGRKTQQELRDALEICAVLRTFDEDILAFILQRNKVTELYHELCELSFVQSYDGRAGLHDVVRDMLREQFRRYSPNRFSEVNRHAAEFYTQRLAQPHISRWEVYLIEKLYHLLVASPDEGFNFFVRVYSEAEKVYRVDLCAALLIEVKQANLMMEQVQWVKFYEGKLLFWQNRWKKAEEIYQKLAVEPANDSKFTAAVLVEWGRVAAYLGQWIISIERYQQALEIWREFGEAIGEAQTLLNLSNSYRLQGNWEAARSSAEASLITWDTLGSKHEKAYVLNLLGDIHRAQGQWAEAEARYLASLNFRRTLSDQHGIGQTLRNLGDVYRLQERLLDAKRCYQESLDIQRAVKDDYEIARLLHSIGRIAFQQNNYREALRNFSFSLKIRKSLGDQYRVARTLRSLADAYTALGDYDLAIANLQETRQLLTSLGDEFGVGLTDDSLGMAWWTKGDLVQAQAAFESCLLIMERNSNRYYQARALSHLFELGQQIQNDTLVMSYESDIVKLDGVQGIDNWLTNIYDALAKVYGRQGDMEKVLEYQQKANEARQRFDVTRDMRGQQND